MSEANLKAWAVSRNVGATTIVASADSAVATGDWMIAIVAWNSVGATHSASGWTQLGTTTTTGTLVTSIWAKVRTAGDSTYTFNSTVSGFGQVVIINGSGGDPIANWVLGTAGTRAASGGTVNTTAPAPATNAKRALVLSVATERTTATEADITVTGATKYFFSAQTGSQIETVAAASQIVAAGSPSSAVVFTYPNSQGSNGFAQSIAIPGNVDAPANPGIAVKYVNAGGTLSDGHVFYVDGTGAAKTPVEVRQFPRGYSTVTSMLSGASTSSPFYVAHRGGSLNWPEMSLHAYTQAGYHGAGALELSLARTSDGVWFGLHDASLDRTSDGTGGGNGTNKVASSMTWAQVQANTNNIGPGGSKPYMRLDEYLAAYAASHVTFIDIKYATGFATELVNILKSARPADYAERFVYKAFGVGGPTPNAIFRNEGIKSWGYFYEASKDSIATEAAKHDIIGMDYSATSDAWTKALAPGKPVIGHIVPDVAAANTAKAFGAVGLMVSGVTAVVPRAL